MIQEACQAVEVLGKHYKPDTTSGTTAILQDLKEYFRRPVVVNSAVFTLNVSGSVFQGNIDLATLATYFTGFQNRLKGVAGISFDLVFTLQIAATPFTQGVLALCWQYDYDATSYYLDRTNLAPLCTNIPHVRIDLSDSTMVQLKIPFLSAVQFLHLASSDNYGTFGLQALLPIRNSASGTTVPSYRLLMHLENLQLFHAVPDSVAPLAFQAGGKAPIDVEFEQEAYPYSSGLHAMSRTFKWIAKGVPQLSSLAGPTSWFLGKAAGVVRYFGFSKPLVQEPPHRMWFSSSIMEHNVDVPSNALMVGSQASNRLKVDENIACSDVDEMSMAYVLGQWSQIARTAYRTTDVVGQNLWGTPVSPSCFWFKSRTIPPLYNSPPPALVSVGSYNAFIPSNLFYWGQGFKQWRGDLEFRFTFSKTKMHGGRVLVQFNPLSGSSFNGVGVGAVGTFDAADTTVPFGYSAIFDMRDNNVFTFKVPYYNNVGYTNMNCCTGTLVMKVFDTLMVSSVISGIVDVLVEVRALPDFEMAIPQTVTYVVADGDATPVFQSGIVQVIKKDISEQSVGESINSVKQLISIPSPLRTNTNAFLSNPIGPNAAIFEAVMPWYTRPPPGSSSLPNTYDYLNMPAKAVNWGAYSSACYLYARGSTDLHVNVIGPEDMTFLGFQLPAVNASATIVSRVIANSAAWLTGKSAHFRFPGYQYAVRTSMNSTDLGVISTSTTYTPISTLDVQYTCGLRVMNGGPGSYYQLRVCAGDDAMLGHYMGPPMLQATPTSANLFDSYSAAYLLNGTAAPPTSLMAAAPGVVETTVGAPLVPQAAEPQATLVEEIQQPVSRTLNVNKVVSPFEPTPPIPITSGDTGVFPSARAGGLTRSLPRAGRVNVEEVKSILDSLAES